MSPVWLRSASGSVDGVTHELAVDEPVERITHAQAAVLLGCHISNIGKLVGKGQLHSTGMRGPGVGTLDLDEVLHLREQRARLVASRRAAEEARRQHDPPADGNEWLTTAQVAERLGVTRGAVTSRVRHDTVPHVRRGKRVWIRADHLEVWQRAKLVAGPDDLTG